MRYEQTFIGNILPDILKTIADHAATDPLLVRIATITVPEQELPLRMQYVDGKTTFFRDHPDDWHMAFQDIAKALHERRQTQGPINTNLLGFRIMHAMEKREIKKLLAAHVEQASGASAQGRVSWVPARAGEKGTLEVPEADHLSRLTDAGKTALIADPAGEFSRIVTVNDVDPQSEGRAIHWNPFHLSDNEEVSSEMTFEALRKQMYEQQILAIDDTLAAQHLTRVAPITLDAHRGTAKTIVQSPAGDRTEKTFDLQEVPPQAEESAKGDMRLSVGGGQLREPEKPNIRMEKKSPRGALQRFSLKKKTPKGMPEVVQRQVQTSKAGGGVSFPMSSALTAKEKTSQQQAPQRAPMPMPQPVGAQRRGGGAATRARKKLLRRVLFGAIGGTSIVAGVMGLPTWLTVLFS